MNLLSQTSRKIYHVNAGRPQSLGLSCRRSLSTSQLKKYLDILQVTKSSTPKEIKDSFLKLSKLYHPDNKVSGSHAKFVELKEAFDAVKDGAPSTTTSTSSSYSSTPKPSYRYYEDIDLTHRTQARYRERYKNDYERSHSGSSYGFGGPYADSSTPWEDLKRDKEFRRKRAYKATFGDRAGRPMVSLTVFFGAIAWIFIYSSVIMIWDYNDQMKRGLARYRSRNYDDYTAYQEYLRRKNEPKMRILRRRQGIDEDEDEELSLPKSEPPPVPSPSASTSPTPIL